MNKAPVYKIVIDKKNHTFCQKIKTGVTVFFDVVTDKDFEKSVLEHKKIIFKLWVMESAFRSKNWIFVGDYCPNSEILKPCWFFKQDPISNRITKYSSNQETGEVIELDSNYDSCYQLERAAVWSHGHIEDRLRDFFDGKEKSLRLKI